MKIISKYKDYYDYLVGIYGEDPKLVLDRRNGSVVEPNYDVFHLYIGNKKIEGVFKDGVYYYGEDLEKIASSRSDRPYYGRRKDYKDCIKYISEDMRNQIVYEVNKYIVDTNKNTELNCPIVFVNVLPSGEKEPILYPKLEDLKLASFLPPKEIWIILSAFLASMVIEPTVPIGGDDIRIQSHGFDLKTSFRPKIKV